MFLLLSVYVLYVCGALASLTTNATSKIDVLWHNGNTLGVECTQIGVLEQTNKVRLGSLLDCKDSKRLETQIGVVVLSNLTHKSLERELANQQLSGLLELPDLTQSHSAWTIAMGLIDSHRGIHFLSRLCCQLLSGHLSSGHSSCSLFSARHLWLLFGMCECRVSGDTADTIYVYNYNKVPLVNMCLVFFCYQ